MKRIKIQLGKFTIQDNMDTKITENKEILRTSQTHQVIPIFCCFFIKEPAGFHLYCRHLQQRSLCPQGSGQAGCPGRGLSISPRYTPAK